MTQSELARKIPVSRSCIANYEGKRRKPAGDILSLLSESLDVSIDYFTEQQSFLEYEIYKRNMSNTMLDISKLPQVCRIAITQYYEFLMDYYVKKNIK